jgi:uncharacterized protein (TIRG00374 family)
LGEVIILNRISINRKRFVPAIVVLIVLIGILFIIIDRNEILKVLGQANWQPLPYALLTTLVSYSCISISFAQVSKLIGIPMHPVNLIEVGFVTTVLNHVVTSGGAAGYSVRYMLMNKFGVGMRDVLASSVLHFYLTSLIMIVMLPIGLIYLILNTTISQSTSIFLMVLASVILLAAIFATSMVFLGSMRRRILSTIEKAARKFIHQDIKAPLARFDATMIEGIQAIRQYPLALVIILLLVVVDWATSAMTLWFCFDAFGNNLSLGELISGFVIGISAGVISMIPGGLGVQEGSMAGIFALLGFSFERAVLASFLFRVVYFIFPYFISFGFYWRILRRKTEF